MDREVEVGESVFQLVHSTFYEKRRRENDEGTSTACFDAYVSPYM